MFYLKFNLKKNEKLAANSWGEQWGENGYFRITRNDDETEFGRHVYSGWGNRPGNKNKNIRLNDFYT